MGTESLFNVTAIIGGDPETALPEAEHRDKEPTLETHSPVDASVDGDWLDWTPFVDVDWSNESVVELNAWPADPEGDREPVTGLISRTSHDDPVASWRGVGGCVGRRLRRVGVLGGRGRRSGRRPG